MARNQHLVLWRNLSAPGAEYCMLQRPSGSWELTGTIVTLAEGEPVTVAYTVSVNNLWQTQAVLVILTKGNVSMSKVWTVDAEQQRWYGAGDEVRKLRGCTDADLGMTPATNTIPVRRLQLELGASAEIKAARVSFPELEIVETKQRYTRISEYRYRYDRHEIRTEFEVDEHGLVVRSEGGWERVAAVTRHD